MAMFESTTSTISDNNESLTLDKLLSVMRELERTYPTIFYMVSDYAPIRDDRKFICIDNLGATSVGYDIVCHSSQVEAMVAELSGKFNVRQMDYHETERRLRKNRKILDYE